MAPRDSPYDPRKTRAGTLSNGDAVDYTIDGYETEIGREWAAGWWAKGRDGRGRLLLSRGKGYRVENALADADAPDARALED